MSDTMLMFKPDCFDPDSPYSFQEILKETMRIGGAQEGWTMDFGAKVRLTRNMVEKLYAEHVDKPFYERLVGFASSGRPSFVSVWSSSAPQTWVLGRDVVSEIRLTHGKHDLEVTGPANIIHGSDGSESANREVRWALRCMVLQCASFREEE